MAHKSRFVIFSLLFLCAYLSLSDKVLAADPSIMRAMGVDPNSASVYSSVQSAITSVRDFFSRIFARDASPVSTPASDPPPLQSGNPTSPVSPIIDNETLRSVREDLIREITRQINELRTTVLTLDRSPELVRQQVLPAQERVIVEREVLPASFISGVDNRINALSGRLEEVRASDSKRSTANYNAISLTNKIDQLTNVRIVSGTVSGGLSGLAVSDIPNLSSLYMPIGGGVITGSSTIQSLTVINSTTTYATTTNLYASVFSAGVSSFTDLTVTNATTTSLAVIGSATTTIAGYLDVNGIGSNSTSTFASNLWVKGTLRTGTGSIYLNDTSITAGNGGFSLNTTGTSSINTALGVGTTTPGSLFSIGGIANFYISTSTFYSTGGINLSGGCFAVSGICVGGASSPFILADHGHILTASSTANIVLATTTNKNNGLLIVGTTSPSLASSTLTSSAARFTLEGSFTQTVGTTSLTFIAETQGTTPGTSLDGARDVFVSGKYAYVANQDRDSLAVIDISNPASPTFIAETQGPNPGTSLDTIASVFISGKYAYVANFGRDSLAVIDISNPASPTFIAETQGPTPGISLDNALSVFVSGKYAYVANNNRDSLAVIDISNPANPTFIAETQGPTPGTSLNAAASVFVSGKYAYMANFNRDSLAVIDISNPANPTFIAETQGPTPGTSLDGARDVFVSGRYAYVANNSRDSLAVIDISNPASPTFIAETQGPTPGISLDGARNVFVSGKYAYVTNQNRDSLAVIDISNPASPTFIAETQGPTPGTSLDTIIGIFVSGKYAYVANNTRDSLAVIDIGGTEISSLLAGNIQTGSINVSDLATFDGSLYVAGGGIISSGFQTNGPMSIFHATTTSASTTLFSISQATASTSISNIMSVLSTGNVGIGTTSPYTKLSIVGETVSSYFTATTTNATSTFGGSLAIGGSNSTTTIAGYLDVNGTGSNSTSTFASNLWVKGTLRTGTGSIYLNDTAIVAGNGAFSINTNATSTYATSTGFVFGDNALAVIPTSGNIGIGTINPQRRLHISSGSVADVAIRMDTANAANVLRVNDSGDYLFNTNNIESVVTFKDQGNVGIGTTSPYAKLSVVGQTVAEYFTATSTAATSSFFGALSIGATSTPGSIFSINGVANFSTATSTFYSTGGINLSGGCFAVSGTCISSGGGSGTVNTGTQGQLAFYNTNGTTLSGTSTLFLAQSGNFGIGTTSPQYSLDVATTTRTTNLITQNITLSQSYGSIIQAVVGSSTGYTNFSGGIGTGGTDSINNAFNNALRITNTGNLVNIGSIQAGETLLTSGGTFATKVDYGTQTTPLNTAVGDLNGDNKADLVVANYDSTSISVFRNLGNGTFASTTLTTASGPQGVAIGDVNGDGKADIAVSNSGSNSVSIFINNGNGTFAAKVDYTTATAPVGVVIGDINGDGKADMAVANYTSAVASVFINNGNGTFAAKVDYSTGAGAERMAIGDLNGDGRADLATANNLGGTVSVLLNNGNGTFATKVDYSAGGSPRGVAIGDLNGDGISDLVTTTDTPDVMSVHINNGNGTFVAKVDYTAGTDPYGVAIADLNGDGRADIVTSNSGTNTVSVFRNLGSGTFADKVDYTAGSSVRDVAIGDLNGDGKADIMTANASSHTTSIFLNQSQSMLYANATNGNLAVGTSTGTTTPYSLFAKLTVWASSTPSGRAFNVIDNASSTLFTITNSGLVGIGTSSPYAKLSVVGETVASYFTATTTNATSTFGGSLAIGGSNSTTTIAGYLDVNGTGANATSTFASNLWVKGTLQVGTGSIYLNDTSITAGNGGFSMDTIGTSTFSNRLGIGTSTPHGAGLLTVGTSTPLFVVNSITGNIGIGTTSPGRKLDVHGDIRLAGSNVGIHSIRSDGASVTRIRFLNDAMMLNADTGGIQLLNGSGQAFGIFTDSRLFGLGTTSPYAKFAIHATDNDTRTTLFTIASSTLTSTTTHLVVTNIGNVGIGTTSPYAKLSVVGQTVAEYFTATSTTATSSFFGALSIGATSTPGSIFSINGVANFSTATSTFYSTGGINLSGGCFAVSGTCISSGGGSGTVNTGTQGQLAFYNTNGTTLSGTSTLFLAQSGNFSIGTSSDPGERLEVLGNIISKGTSWTSRTSAADNSWYAVTYGNGLFVAVAYDGTGNRVMTSPDGINWTVRNSPADNGWNAVTYANGLFVAVADSGSGNRVMTSPDGINWTTRTSAADNQWRSVTYGNGLFVAVADSGAGNRVMTSPDGINWTSRTSAANNSWQSVTFGNGLFVAVSVNGVSNRVMTSPDGINWTTRTSAADNQWYGVTYGNGLFVAVSNTGSGNRVMTSPDGINWTSRTSAEDNSWLSVVYGNGLFVAVAEAGSANRVMTSPNGINWTSRPSAASNAWFDVAYGNGLFVAVSYTGSGNRVMTSGKTDLNILAHNNIFQGGINIFGSVAIGTSSPTTTPNALFAGLNVWGAGATADTYALNVVNSASTTLFTVSNGGNVGIGTTSPWRRFSADGTVGLSSNLTTAGVTEDALCIDPTTFEMTRNSGATTCTVSSARFKNNIQDIDVGLSELRRLRPVSFNSNANNKAHIGFIAEEVNEIDPRLVFYDADGVTPRGVHYEELTALLAKAIQDLASTTDQMKLDLENVRLAALAGADGSRSLSDNILEVIADIKNWVVETLTAKEVKTDKFCLKDVCIGEDEFRSLLEKNNIIPTTGISSTPSVADQEDESPEVLDTEPPVITLIGDTHITIEKGISFVDPGATVDDNMNKNLGIQVIGDKIDTTILGEHTITYDATDQAGNKAVQVVRVVTVLDPFTTEVSLESDTASTSPAEIPEEQE